MDNNNSPQFTRRHYVWLASAMRDVLNKTPSPNGTDRRDSFSYGIRTAIETFADALASENPRFDKEMFINNVFCPNLIKDEVA